MFQKPTTVHNIAPAITYFQWILFRLRNIHEKVVSLLSVHLFHSANFLQCFMQRFSSLNNLPSYPKLTSEGTYQQGALAGEGKVQFSFSDSSLWYVRYAGQMQNCFGPGKQSPFWLYTGTCCGSHKHDLFSCSQSNRERRCSQFIEMTKLLVCDLLLVYFYLSNSHAKYAPLT